MELKLYSLTSEEIQALPLDRLGMIVLDHLVATNQDNAHNFTNDGRNKGIQKETLRCWAEALNWLISQNLVSRDDPGLSSGQAIFVTRLGHRVLKEGIENIKAIERLDLSLHPRLEKVRSQFLIGDYELAAFAAMREVEIRVRELSDLDHSLIGVKLMRKAFGNGGPLENTDLEAGERHGLMELFAGAIGTFKNPPSHRQVDYADPTEASEVILLSDLLMRLLERYNSRSDEG
jgi:uncharacterized protein (TIGR02391 family)